MKKPQNRILIFVFTLFIFNALFLIHNCSSQWMQCNGISNQITIAFTSKNNLLFSTGNSYGVYKSTDNGANWFVTSMSGIAVFALTSDGTNIYAGTGGNGVYKSTNDGLNWYQTSLNTHNVYSLIYTGNNLIAGINYGTQISTNGGLTWTNNGLDNQLVNSFYKNQNYLYAACDYAGIYISTNYGFNWTSNTLSSFLVYEVAANGNNLFAGLENYGVLVSTNNGANWSDTSLSNNTVQSILSFGNLIFAAPYSPTFMSTSNNGLNWISHLEGLPPNIYIYQLFIANNYIFAGVGSVGVFRRNLNELIGITPISNSVPTRFALYQNYPNPFNPSTTIEFSLPLMKGVRGMDNYRQGGEVGVKVKLSIFDITGREVATLVNESLQPGKYKVDWNATNYSSGVYFYKIKAGDFISTKKMILLK